MNNNRKIYLLLPFLLTFVLCVGIYMGTQIGGAPNAGVDAVGLRFNKLQEIINYIEHDYVDTVSRERLEEIAINSILQELDPHSVYIPPADLEAFNEPLEGNFDGIGIEFNIVKDTVVVVSPIIGGPSEMLGVKAGDRIVRVGDSLIAGIDITNNKVISLLRGKKGTQVSIEVLRKGEKKPIRFEITRDEIPIYSVDIAYMINEKTGYLKISRFAKTTYDEFMEGVISLKKQGMKNLILDLRGNGGGFLDQATKIADEFLVKDKIIVYTQGKAREKQIYYATDIGALEEMPLTVIIDEGSASASEIIAGAIQDNDRGTIVGRRSFGKGLVQEPTDWPDGSSIRLTIARYYTPTGRCIQKPYNSKEISYQEELLGRYKNGEFQHKDSISFPDSLKYTTPEGKVVYGGGGIMPDVFVPIDTTGSSYYFSELYYRGLFRQFAFDYVDKNRALYSGDKTYESLNKKFRADDSFLNLFFDFAEKKGVQKSEEDIKKSKVLIANRLKADVFRYLIKDAGYYPVIFEIDPAFSAAVKSFQN